QSNFLFNMKAIVDEPPVVAPDCRTKPNATPITMPKKIAAIKESPIGCPHPSMIKTSNDSKRTFNAVFSIIIFGRYFKPMIIKSKEEMKMTTEGDNPIQKYNSNETPTNPPSVIELGIAKIVILTA